MKLNSIPDYKLNMYLKERDLTCTKKSKRQSGKLQAKFEKKNHLKLQNNVCMS